MKKGLILGLIAAMLPCAALAQSGAPAQPADPTPTNLNTPTVRGTGSQPSDYQAIPKTTTGTTAGTSTGTTATGAVTGYSGGDLMITDINPALYGDGSGRRKVPDYHTVVKGDTLWTLCQFYYGDSWAWPQLWAYNTEITNPHWIYPGDRVRMLGVVKSVKGPGKEEVKMLSRPRLISKVMRLRQQGFVENKELPKAATVLGSLKERKMLTIDDEIYIKGAKQFKPTLGKLFTIYRVDRELRDFDGEDLGHLVRILGTARIKRLTKNKAATALVIEAYSEIRRGDLVGPLRRTYKAVPLRPAEKDLEGRIIANLPDIKGLGEWQMVFLDRGKNHGVRLGNRFLVIRQGDGAESMIPSEMDDDEIAEYPEETVAEISILDVKDKACMGMVTRSLREIRNGDRVRMRKGY